MQQKKMVDSAASAAYCVHCCSSSSSCPHVQVQCTNCTENRVVTEKAIRKCVDCQALLCNSPTCIEPRIFVRCGSPTNNPNFHLFKNRYTGRSIASIDLCANCERNYDIHPISTTTNLDPVCRSDGCRITWCQMCLIPQILQC